MKKMIVSFAFVLALFALPAQSHAGSSLEVVFWDSLMGAGIGALVGGATLAFMEHPSDHYERIAQGASIGLVCGLGFGIYEISPMFYTTTTPSGKKARVYGLQVKIPLQ
jgi:NhaP-type Na+/H+ or K+/H+ antiporter